jgi:phosphatidylethanolamine/phosphatidyl-N-methylethanolamine N-methyltransferase
MESDILLFLRSWVAQPLRVGAISPSSESLAELITRDIGPETGSVVELGPGTGVFTAKLLQRGVRTEDLVLIECDPVFAQRLRTQFPSVRVLTMDAARLTSADLGVATPVGAVVSGLPLLSMSSRQVLAILDGVFARLDRRGAFYQFTYAGRCPIRRQILDRLGLKATWAGSTLRNLPPAAVYRVTRRRPRRGSQLHDEPSWH